MYDKYDFLNFQGITNSKNQYDTVPIILVGNKSDLEKDRQIEEEEGKEVGTA